VAKSVLRPLSRTLLRPETASPTTVLAVALAPSLLAGLVLFRTPAAEILAVALVAGGAVHLAARVLGLQMRDSPVLASVVGVALVGPGTALAWAGLVALAAALLELARVRLAPAARLQTGLLAYVAALLVGGGLVTAYLNPATGSPLAEPIRVWHDLSATGQTPIDPIKLYVGNVPGPVFATSLLAAVIGAAWLWYARRMSVLVLAAFTAGAAVAIVYYRWSVPYQLISGPLWFTAALVLADGRQLPDSRVGRPLIGFSAGLLALAARSRGLAIESTMEAVAAVQVASALVMLSLSPLTRPQRSAVPATPPPRLRPATPGPAQPAGPVAPPATSRPPSAAPRGVGPARPDRAPVTKLRAS
jgi:NQR2/RnfD/RnfE family subunit of NADH-ubiquinone oxidoreductase